MCYFYLCELKNILINFPNLLELSFLTVFAFPKASNKGFESKTCSSIEIYE